VHDALRELCAFGEDSLLKVVNICLSKGDLVVFAQQSRSKNLETSNQGFRVFDRDGLPVVTASTV